MSVTTVIEVIAGIAGLVRSLGNDKWADILSKAAKVVQAGSDIDVALAPVVAKLRNKDSLTDADFDSLNAHIDTLTAQILAAEPKGE